MLLRFGCENFRSFRDYQELSLVASSLKDNGSDLFDAQSGRLKVLPIAVIYGANASGKTNSILALQSMASMIRGSHREQEPDAPIARKVFAFDPDCKSSTSRFDCDLMIGDTRFHYGFEFDDLSFHEEWLYAFEGGHRRAWFYRDRQGFTFGKYLRGQNRLIADITRKNSLFVSAAAQNNHEQLKPIYDFFVGIRFNMQPNSYNLISSFQKRETLRDRCIAFLKSADTGVCAASLGYLDPDPEVKKMMADFAAFFKSRNPDQAETWDNITNEPPKQPELKLGHADLSANPVFLPLDDESRGTRRALELALDVFDALESGGVLVVDEMEASLHTLLSSSLVGLFASQDTNPNKAQLICTTHDTNLLCSKSLRRDQIWFAEKDRFGQTHVYPLTSIRTRNTDNLEKGYLQGRFGAVPFFGGITELFASEEA